MDEPTTSGESSTADNSETEHVETVTPHESTPTAAKLVEQNNKLSPIPVETLINKNAVKAHMCVCTCLEKKITLSIIMHHL